jgi:hypothetical protein
MIPLAKRGYDVKPQVIKVAKTNMDYMEQDANGAWIPKGPGEVVPVYQLPAPHPARQYLQTRGFDAEELWYQFRLSYCTNERTDIYYAKMLNGFRATPQGRIVFYIDIDGINRGWTARILDFEKDGFRYYLHPYAQRWIKVLQKNGEKWAPAEDRWVGWEDKKYILCSGCKRNECLLGFDVAVAWNNANPDTRGPWCVLSEGPLDAGRIGPPGMAIFQNYLCRGYR